MKANGYEVAKQAVKEVAGVPQSQRIKYDDYDCKQFVQEMIKRAGGRLDTSGTNDMVRNHNAWLGTLSNAKQSGKMIPGAMLMIHTSDESELPSKYKGDGLGDFYHVAIYCGENAVYDDVLGKKCSAVHSSQSRGGVYGTTDQNGYTHVLLLQEIEYGVELKGGVELTPDAEEILKPDTEQTVSPTPAPKLWVMAVSGNGGDVRIREKPSKSAVWKYSVPVGTKMPYLGDRGKYYKVELYGKGRYIDKNFAVLVE